MEFCFDKIKWGLPFTFAVGVFTQAFGQEQRPNLVYIFADQYRLNALSLWSNPAYRNVLSTVGDPVHTPNLDRLAKQGVVFSRACSTCPLSSPHRAMLMTGMFPEKNGVDTNCFKGKKQGIPDSISFIRLSRSNNPTLWISINESDDSVQIFQSGFY